MKFSLDKQDNYTVLSVSEKRLDSLVAPNLKAELAILSNAGIVNIILDLTAVTFVDSSGLSAILVGNRLCQNAGGALLLCNLHPSTTNLIKISQLDTVLNIAPTLQEAKDLIMMEALMQELEQDDSENNNDSSNDDDE